jgi:hypothetical protein
VGSEALVHLTPLELLSREVCTMKAKIERIGRSLSEKSKRLDDFDVGITERALNEAHERIAFLNARSKVEFEKQITLTEVFKILRHRKDPTALEIIGEIIDAMDYSDRWWSDSSRQSLGKLIEKAVSGKLKEDS